MAKTTNVGISREAHTTLKLEAVLKHKTMGELLNEMIEEKFGS